MIFEILIVSQNNRERYMEEFNENYAQQNF